MEDFEDVYQEIAWELCIDAAGKAKTDLTFLVFTERTGPDKGSHAPTLEAASEKLAASRNAGGVRVRGGWMAGGRQGNLDVICDERFSPTVTPQYISRVIGDMVRLRIAKDLFHRGSPTIDFVENQED